jgi:DnaD/phage-associated family protein
MSAEAQFNGFPAIGKGTVLPNAFFTDVLPQLRTPAEVLAFLWVCRLVQEQRGDHRFVSAEQLWAVAPARAAFESAGADRHALDRGLERCRELGALLALRLAGEAGQETVYFVNNPGSRRAVARAHAGELALRPETVALPPETEQRPGIFRLYEENIGTVTPLVGERLLAAIDDYPAEWIEEAFREAAELNRRNWRYIERILQKWAQEGRGYEASGRDSFEERKRRYLGGALGGVAGRR